jgi:hypothetical protein
MAAGIAAGRDLPPDLADIIGVVGACKALEDGGLANGVGSGGVGLGDVERDLALGQRLEHRRRQIGEAQTTLHEDFLDTEALGDIGGGLVLLLDDRAECRAGIGGVHRELEEVLRKAHRDRVLGGRDDHDRDLEVFRQDPFLDVAEGARQAAAASIDVIGIFAALDRNADQVLKNNAGLTEMGFEPDIGFGVRVLAHIVCRDPAIGRGHIDDGIRHESDSCAAHVPDHQAAFRTRSPPSFLSDR